MKAKELIKALQKLVKENGDLECVSLADYEGFSILNTVELGNFDITSDNKKDTTVKVIAIYASI